jgi:hypothetical protein
MRRRAVLAWFAGPLLLAASSQAWAQGYEVQQAQLETLPAPPPPSAVRLALDTKHSERAKCNVQLPFVFRFYGVATQTVTVGVNGWILPFADAAPANASEPTAAHGQDTATGAFPYAGDADGILAALWTSVSHVEDGTPGAGAVVTWTETRAGNHLFHVEWHGVAIPSNPKVSVRVSLEEETGRIWIWYEASAITGAAVTDHVVAGLDERGGKRFATFAGGERVLAGVPPNAFVLVPRTTFHNSRLAGAPKGGSDVTWQHVRRESLSADDSARACCYVAKGEGWLFTPDRAIETPDRTAALAAEDAALCHGAAGDPRRWVRQVLDAKATLIPRDGTEPVRFWFRVVEYFTIDDSGASGPDTHLWNLRRMIDRVFPANDPRSRIENYAAWRAVAKGRLTVVKLFDAKQRDDAGRQWTSGRRNEYVLWSARYKAAPRGPLPDHDCPDSWVRLTMKDDAPDKDALQHADAQDVRELIDPNYVDGGYEYVVKSDEDRTGWINRSRTRLAGMREETVDEDP